MKTISIFRHKKIKGVALHLLMFIAILGSIQTNAQNKTIKFENGTWEEIKAKSIKENKLVFLDAYASWCGICKKMDKNVFTNDTVADYFNSNFINAKINMEAGEGIDIAKQYNVSVYPSFLFIDGQGKVKHRTEDGLQAPAFIELAIDAQNPDKQNNGITKTGESDSRDDADTKFNKTEIGFNISQYQRDFGIGIHVISPYFFGKTVAIRAGTNVQWFENSNGVETTLSTYQNIQLGIRGRSAFITHHIYVYGEGGLFIILQNSNFSSQSSVIGGYGLFGFEFRIIPSLAYFIELGGVGTGATADKIAGKPVYSNGFMTNVGFRIAF